MTRYSMVSIGAALLLGLAVAAPTQGALVSVDFGLSTSPVQNTFDGMIGATNASSGTDFFGPYTVTVSGQGFFASNSQTGVIGGSFPDLYGDYYYNNSNTPGDGVTLSITGVVPNQLYDVRLWAYDTDVTATTNSFTPIADTTGTSGVVSYLNGPSTSNPPPDTLNQYSTLIRVSSTTNTLTIFETIVTGTGGSRLNAFSLIEVPAVPEPTTAMLIALGAFGLIRVHRRRLR